MRLGMTATATAGPSIDLYRGTGGAHKIFIQNFLFPMAPVRHGSCKIFMQGPVREDPSRISTRSSVQGLYRITQSMFKILTLGRI